MSEKYSIEFIISYVLENIQGVEYIGDKIFEIECPQCGKKYKQAARRTFYRIINSKLYKNKKIDKLPCSRICRSIFLGSFDFITEAMVKTTRERYGDEFYKRNAECLHESIIEKYGSFSNLSKEIQKKYYEKTGYTHNMRNPESMKKNRNNRLETIKNMSKEKKDEWSKKRMESYRKNNSLFGNKKPIFYGRSSMSDFFFEELSLSLTSFSP